MSADAGIILPFGNMVRSAVAAPAGVETAGQPGTPEASLLLAGGKGRALAALAAAGLPVPDGFVLTTGAYQRFVDNHGLLDVIQEALANLSAGNDGEVEASSLIIRQQFEDAQVPEAIAHSVVRAYRQLGDLELPVAVRSSATAEDLPGMSFAGQQDSFLNVCGTDALLRTIRACWASLWSARAISYRLRMGVDQQRLAMAVVVQRMVAADTAGILFTANPASGDRGELVVNASFGLGEAIVSGEVTPDTFVLARQDLQVTRQDIRVKPTKVVAAGFEGTRSLPVEDKDRQAPSLTPGQLSDLGRLSLAAEQLFDDVPQDIEWAIHGEDCWLLQSRPITNLPAPGLQDVRWEPPTPGGKLIRRQIVENMPEPLSPLFEDLYLGAGLDQSLDHMMEKFGFPFEISDVIDRPLFLTVNGYAYCQADYRIKPMLRRLPQILVWYVRRLPGMLRNMIPVWEDEALPEYLAAVERWRAVEPATAGDAELLSGVRALALADARYWFPVAMVMGFAKITDGMLHSFLSSRLVPGNLTSGMFLRGFESPTLAAQQELEAIAERVRANDALVRLVSATAAEDLLDALAREPAGERLQADIRSHLERYGHQIYDLDFVMPTQAEEPLPILLSLKFLVDGGGEDISERRARLVREREALERQTLGSLGKIRRMILRKLLRWAQQSGPHREEALFYMGAGWPTLRRLALEVGTRLAGVGTLGAAGDVFFLTGSELDEACAAHEVGLACGKLAEQAQSRRQLREARKRLHPPGMVPPGSSFFKFGPFDGSLWETQKRNAADASRLNGFAVSPGKVTGIASVILSPEDFPLMARDTILVCPTTTPAWTPLFGQARGLVTDIGGILAHGSIVAREYGIPAVMGTGNVTQRVVSGQTITVDGDTGTVTLTSL